jgi:hypothetical protein
MADADRAHELVAEHRVTPLELFFDLVLVWVEFEDRSTLDRRLRWLWGAGVGRLL